MDYKSSGFWNKRGQRNDRLCAGRYRDSAETRSLNRATLREDLETHGDVDKARISKQQQGFSTRGGTSANQPNLWARRLAGSSQEPVQPWRNSFLRLTDVDHGAALFARITPGCKNRAGLRDGAEGLCRIAVVVTVGKVSLFECLGSGGYRSNNTRSANPTEAANCCSTVTTRIDGRPRTNQIQVSCLHRQLGCRR